MRTLVALLLSLFAVPAFGAEIPWSAPQTITAIGLSADSLIAADVDGDGDLDVLSASLNNDWIAWYENTDGLGTFGAQQTITTLTDGAESVFAADVDGDGDIDVLSASNDDDKIAWYENTDGLGSFGPQLTITTLTVQAQSVFAADVDGDGDIDVLSASFDGQIAWYENTDGLGSFGPQQTIATPANAVFVFAADVDGDGDIDVLSAALTGEIAWHENTNGLGTAWTPDTITTATDGAQQVFAADVDGDGDIDVLSASNNDDKIAWYENTDGLGTFGPQRTITTLADNARSVFAADVDGDGDIDVLSASFNDNRIAWYENTDGLGNFGPQQTIATLGNNARSLFAADVDGDGDIDVLSGSGSFAPIAWHENETLHSSANLVPEQNGEITTLTNTLQSVFVADIDSDGDLDVLSASELDGTIAWYENTDALGRFGPQQTITTTAPDAYSVFAADLDGDGDTDVLYGSLDASQSNPIVWYENDPNNTGVKGTFVTPQTISISGRTPSVFAADVNGDGDLDVLSAVLDPGNATGVFEWWENTDGLGSFAVHFIGVGGGPLEVFPADLNGDGDLDVIGSSLDGVIAWFENTDGLGTFGPPQTITALAGGQGGVFAADIDGDGDLDVLSPASAGGVAWYENTDGLGTFGVQLTIATGVPGGKVAVFAADADGDGDLDVFSSSSDDWWENLDGLGGSWSIRSGCRTIFASDLDGDGDLDVLSGELFFNRITWCENETIESKVTFRERNGQITTEALGAQSVFAADLDGDGDLDALSASNADDRIAWYENSDGMGNFGAQQTITTAADGATSVVAADMDGDGDLDVLSASLEDDRILWYENDPSDIGAKGSFSSPLPVAEGTFLDGVNSAIAADLDGDGLLDVLAVSLFDGAVTWWRNDFFGLGSPGDFGLGEIIEQGVPWQTSVFAADVDGDGDLDALSASLQDGQIAWYENTDGLGSFGPQQTITTSALGALSVFAADLDGDGDVDVLSASGAGIAWYENTDGLGSFGPQLTITTAVAGANSVVASDADGDGDLDVFSSSSTDDRIAWYENMDGLGTFGPQQTITTAAFVATSVFAADVDGDGDVDALSSSQTDSRIVWYENRLGQAVLSTTSLEGGSKLPGETVELLSVEVKHLGRATDADLELATLELLFDGAPSTPLTSDPADPLTTSEGNALIDNLRVYLDDGSGVLEPGTDTLVTTVSTLALTKGIQTVSLTGPDALVTPGSTALYFVEAELSISAPGGSFRVRHLRDRSQVLDAASAIVLSQTKGTPTQPLLIEVSPAPNTLVSSSIDGAPDSLRDVVGTALSGATITFDPSLSGIPQLLTLGPLVIDKDLTIDGSALPDLTISGNDSSRIFEIQSGQTLSILNLTIADGRADVILSGETGGCILNIGTLNFSDSTLTGCIASQSGGGLANQGEAHFIGSTIHSNQAGTLGGGIHQSAVGSTLEMINTTVVDNQANGIGPMDDAAGAGIYVFLGKAVLRNTTISNNQATNPLAAGGGLFSDVFCFTTPPCLIVENSIIAGNLATSAPDILLGLGTAHVASGANLIGNNEGAEALFPTPGPLIGTPMNPLDPGLAPLADNGGPTLTMLPLMASPALDAAIATPDSPSVDQRGVSRPQGLGGDDLGAVELEPALVAIDFTFGSSLQSGFLAQALADAVYPVEVFGSGAVMTVDLPLTGTRFISTQAFNPVASSDSLFVPDGTEIGFLSATTFVKLGPDASIEITLSGLDAGTYAFEGWWSDLLLVPGLDFIGLESSTDGGTSFTTVSDMIDPGGLNASPVAFAFAAGGVQDVVIRVTENNASDVLRLNAFVVPEPGFAGSLALGVGLLGMLHRRSARRKIGATHRRV